MKNTTFAQSSSQVEQQDVQGGIDLDIRVATHPESVTLGVIQGSDYLTCKTDSTCDDGGAC